MEKWEKEEEEEGHRVVGVKRLLRLTHAWASLLPPPGPSILRERDNPHSGEGQWEGGNLRRGGPTTTKCEAAPEEGRREASLWGG